MLDTIDLRGFTGDLRRRIPRPQGLSNPPVAAVSQIIEEVRRGGDRALVDLTARFDSVAIDSVRVSPSVLAGSLDALPPDLVEALALAKDQIAAFQLHRANVLAGQGSPSAPAGATVVGFRSGEAFERSGARVSTYLKPVRRAGIYVPGGRALYPSTVLMSAVVARVAGVERIAMCVPPGVGGMPPVETLAAAQIAGVDEVYCIGGAQAIAALAYGTESVEPVDVIVGPGNVYVSLAKQQVAGAVGVPGAFAGPSEVVVVADSTTPVELAAIDLAVQAEHGPDGLAWLVSWSEGVIGEVIEALVEVVEASPRRGEIASTLLGGGYAALVEGPDQAVELIDAIGPEHLEIACDGPEALALAVRNAGCIFLGPQTPASLGDYFAGPSHVLPTNGTARFAGVLSLEDFLKEVNVVTASTELYDRAGTGISLIAEAEGLPAHAESIRLRLGSR